MVIYSLGYNSILLLSSLFKLFQLWSAGVLFRLVPVFLAFFIFPLLALEDAPVSLCIFSALILEAVISPRSPGSLYWRTILETKIWAVDVLTAAGVPLLLGLLSRKSKKTCVCIPTLM